MRTVEPSAPVTQAAAPARSFLSAPGSIASSAGIQPPAYMPELLGHDPPDLILASARRSGSAREGVRIRVLEYASQRRRSGCACLWPLASSRRRRLRGLPHGLTGD